MAADLADRVTSVGDRLQAGFLGTRALILGLAEHGYVDLAYRVITGPERPSWGYMVDQGATTVWERWDSDEKVGSGMNSLTHSPFSLVSEWFYHVLGGIAYDRAYAERRELTLRPSIPSALDEVRASVERPYGTIRSAWECSDGGIDFEVTIPGNLTGRLALPVTENATLLYQNERFPIDSIEPTPGGDAPSLEDGRAVVHVEPGNHRLRAEPAPGN